MLDPAWPLGISEPALSPVLSELCSAFLSNDGQLPWSGCPLIPICPLWPVPSLWLHVQGQLIALSGPLRLREVSAVLQGSGSYSMCFRVVKIATIYWAPITCYVLHTQSLIYFFAQSLSHYYSFTNFSGKKLGLIRLNTLPQLMKLLWKSCIWTQIWL